MIPLLVGAAGAWALSRFLSTQAARQDGFPSVPGEWWKPREKLFFMKAEALSALRQSEKMCELYEEYAGRNPDHTLGLLLRSYAASGRGDWQQALEHAEELAAREPKLSVGAWRLVECCEKLGDGEGAAAAAKRFIALEPTSKWVPHFKTTIARVEKQSRRRKKKPAKKKRVSARTRR